MSHQEYPSSGGDAAPQKYCSHHDKVMDVFCRSDQECICYLCTIDEHKGHDTVSAATERADKQKQLGVSQLHVRQKVQEREREGIELQQAVESLKRSAQAAVVDSENTFTEMISSIWKRCTEVKEMIRAHEKVHISQLEEHLRRSKKEMAELKKKSTELGILSHTKDHVHFLQSYQCLPSPIVSSDVPCIVSRPLQYFGDVSKTVSMLTEKFDDFLKGEWHEISSSVKGIDVLLPPEPKTREQFLQYSCQLTLDPNTTHTQLVLSEGNRKVAFTFQNNYYPPHPDRFTYWLQVLAREGLTGRCYWEVDWSGSYVGAAVSYKDIRRAGSDYDSMFGSNDMSWRLECSDSKYWFKHNHEQTEVPGPQSSRIGVYLDHREGNLSFYSVFPDTVTLLHRVQTTFTQPLYAGFYVWYASAELCKLH